MRKKIYQFFYNKDLGVREKIFRLIILVGEMVAIRAVIKAFFFQMGFITILLVALAVVMGIAGILTIRDNHVAAASIVADIALSGLVFPIMFFGCGGIDGGSSVWFVLGIFYALILFDGVKLHIFLIFNIVSVAVTYVLAYFHPEWVVPFGARYEVFWDSFMAILIVGMVCGIIIRFQIRLYAREREVVQKQKEELELANQSQNAFFASMSHEIRTPINTVIGLNEMILRSRPSDEIAEYAQNVQVSSKMLLSLVNDILDISQITQQRMKITPIVYSTREMFYEIVEMMWVSMEEKKLGFIVEIAPDIPSGLFGDEKRIQQILVNLLTNALKYTREGYVRLSASSENLEDGYVMLRILVQDTGIGIRKEDIDGLYDAFRRADLQRNVNIEGSGLGLAITKNLIDLMEGTISVDSIYTKGSTFTVALKQKVEDAKPIGEVNFFHRRGNVTENYYEQSFEAPEARVLVVDDNDANAFVVKKLLEATKVQIDVVSSGVECLQATQKKFYNIILMDYMMPEMNGIETFQALRRQANSLCRDSSVILVTASGIAEAKALQEQYGFESCLEKPIKAEQLELEILRNLPDDIVEYRSDSDYSGGKNVKYASVFRKKRKLCITTDCVCDLPVELLEKDGIKVMSLYIKTAHGRFADTYEIDSDNLEYYLMQNNEYVKADSVSVEEYETFFAEVLEGAEEVVHISMAERCGKSYGVAVAASKCFDHVHVIDCGHISGGEGLLVLYAAMLMREGYQVDTIIPRIEERKHKICTRFVLSGAQTFYQNGYTDRLTAGVCRLIHARPILSIRNSRIFISGILFGRMTTAWRMFIRLMMWWKHKINSDIVIVTYVGVSSSEREWLRKEIEKHMDFEEIIFQKASLSNACNAGMPTIGIAYYKK